MKSTSCCIVPTPAPVWYLRREKNQEQVKYRAAHHELVASALATKIAHQVNPQNRVGCMLAGGNFYPYSCKPEDVWMALEKDRENLFFIDVQARGAYPVWAARVFREKGVTIAKQPGDDEILKKTPLILSPLAITPRAARQRR